MRVAIRWRTWFSRLRALIREGAHLYLISVGMVLRESLFRMVVVVTLGLEVIGIYDIALRVTRLMRQLIASGFVSLYPSFATLLRQNDRSSAAKLTRVSLFALVAVGGASLGLVSVACDVLYAIWLGLENRELVAATQILAVWQFVTLLNVPYWYLLQSAHLERNAASALWWHTASLLLLPVLTGFVTFDLQKILAYWLVTSLLTQAYIFYLVEKKLHMFWSSVSSVRVLASVGAMLACLVGTPLLDGGDLAGSSPFRLSYVAWTALVCVALAATWAPLSASLRSLQR